MGVATLLRAAAAAILAALLAAAYVDACGYMVVEETCERRHLLPQPCAQPQPQPQPQPQLAVPALYALPYPVHIANVHQPHGHDHGKKEDTCPCGGSKHDGTCTCGKKKDTCPCGGSKHDGTCTCGKKKDTCPCGGSKHDGTCTCGKKKDDVSVKEFAEEGLSALFKVMRGGMRMVGHLADHINKKGPCGPGGPCAPGPCGCGPCPPKKACGACGACGAAPCCGQCACSCGC